MATGIEKRHQLFNKFSKQLLLLRANGIIDIDFKNDRPYLCPICLREFSEDDLENSATRNFLTLEDAPPDALGGHKIALTCKECNSECGHKIDFHLIEVLRAIDASFFYKGAKLYAHIIHEGKKLRVELTSEGDGTLQAYHRTKNNDPTLLDKFIYGIKNKTAGPLLNFEPPKPRFDSAKVNYALVKANYILTFARFGYIFLLDPAYKAIREQLLRPDEIIYPWTPFIKDQFEKKHVGTYYILNKDMESILNVFLLKTEYSETVIAGMLPLPSYSTEQFCKNVDAQRDRENVVTIQTSKYDPNADLFSDIREIIKIWQWARQSIKVFVVETTQLPCPFLSVTAHISLQFFQ